MLVASIVVSGQEILQEKYRPYFVYLLCEGRLIHPLDGDMALNGFKQKEGRFSSDIRKQFFTIRVVKHWNRLPREAVDAPSLETFQARLVAALSNLKMSLLTAGQLG